MQTFPNQESRQDRYGKTERKNLTLTREAIAAVAAYAERHELCFSVAIETLAWAGIAKEEGQLLPRFLGEIIEQIMRQYAERITPLLAQAAHAAAETDYKADVLLLQTIWREARQDPDGFADRLQVSADPGAHPDALARRLRDGVRADAEAAAVARLKRALGEDPPFATEESDE
jgi:hypothetical protein